MNRSCLLFTLFVTIFSANAQIPESPRTITKSRPVQKQWRGIFDFPSINVFVSNDFPGGSMAGMMLENDSTIIGLITPENTPINESPWYAFKIWSEEKKDVHVKLTYTEGSKHRYYPKYSKDRIFWAPLDSADFLGPRQFKYADRPLTVTMKLHVGPDTLWVAGQEMYTSEQIFGWMDLRSSSPEIRQVEIGKSVGGRPIKALEIGERSTPSMVMIISRQHPPEVTGYLAMKTFVETLSGDSYLARAFRKKFATYVVPLVNPDGVEAGHWRHNSRGVDLNRDWADFNQPETRAVRDYMHQRVSENGGRFYFAIDFHSTWEDIYYTVGSNYVTGNVPGLVPRWLENVKERLPGYELNISPNDQMEPTLVSRNYFYMKYGAESLVYEIGDNTPRDFLERKSRTGAEELMKLLLMTPEIAN